MFRVDDLKKLENTEVSVGFLDDTVNFLYEKRFFPIGPINNDYRLYKFNNLLIKVNYLFTKRSEYGLKNKVKILNIEAIRQ